MFNKILAIKDLIAETFTSTHGSVEFELQKNDFGIVHYETAMIERIVERVAAKIKGVNKAKAIVDKPSGEVPLKIRFTMGIKQDYSANEISAQLRDDVKKVLSDRCGIVNATVDIRITDIEKVERKLRVR